MIWICAGIVYLVFILGVWSLCVAAGKADEKLGYK